MLWNTGVTSSQGASVAAKINLSAGDDWEMKLIEIEKSVKRKSNEVKTLSIANAALEERNVKLEQELLMSKMKIGQQVQAVDDVLETKDFKKKCGDLEIELRRKTRDFGRLESKIQNQILLEEELSTANMKLKLVTDSLEKGKNIETLYQAMLDEKKEWSTLFQGILTENDELSQSESIAELRNIRQQNPLNNFNNINVTPSVALKALGSVQMKYVLLLKSQREVEINNLEHRKQIKAAETASVKMCEEKELREKEMERSMSRLRLAQRQMKLFEGEVTSLRTLLSSFDIEFSMGRPSNDKLFEMKDRVISGLQQELDLIRNEAKSFSEMVDTLQHQLSVKTASDGVQTEGTNNV